MVEQTPKSECRRASRSGMRKEDRQLMRFRSWLLCQHVHCAAPDTMRIAPLTRFRVADVCMYVCLSEDPPPRAGGQERISCLLSISLYLSICTRLLPPDSCLLIPIMERSKDQELCSRKKRKMMIPFPPNSRGIMHACKHAFHHLRRRKTPQLHGCFMGDGCSVQRPGSGSGLG